MIAFVCIYMVMSMVTTVLYFLVLEATGRQAAKAKDMMLVVVFWPLALGVLFAEAMGASK